MTCSDMFVKYITYLYIEFRIQYEHERRKRDSWLAAPDSIKKRLGLAGSTRSTVRLSTDEFAEVCFRAKAILRLC